MYIPVLDSTAQLHLCTSRYLVNIFMQNQIHKVKLYIIQYNIVVKDTSASTYILLWKHVGPGIDTRGIRKQVKVFNEVR